MDNIEFFKTFTNSESDEKARIYLNKYKNVDLAIEKYLEDVEEAKKLAEQEKQKSQQSSLNRDMQNEEPRVFKKKSPIPSPQKSCSEAG